MQIRRMTLQDCGQVAAIEAASFSMPWSLQAFIDTVEKENYRYFVAEEEKEILGTVEKEKKKARNKAAY